MYNVTQKLTLILFQPGFWIRVPGSLFCGHHATALRPTRAGTVCAGWHIVQGNRTGTAATESVCCAEDQDHSAEYAYSECRECPLHILYFVGIWLEIWYRFSLKYMGNFLYNNSCFLKLVKHFSASNFVRAWILLIGTFAFLSFTSAGFGFGHRFLSAGTSSSRYYCDDQAQELR